jgi:hypothetical protein
VLCMIIWAQQKLVLPCATSPFAASLYGGGRTVHSIFKVSQLPQIVQFL